MNIAYFRKSKFSADKTIEHIKGKAKTLGFTVLGTTELPGKKGTVVHVCHPVWMGNLIAADANLVGLLPCTVVVLSKNDYVLVGVGSPAVLGGVSQHPAVMQLASQAEQTLRQLVQDASGVGPLKPAGITLYSTTTCPYCKAEAAWLSERNVSYEEVHVDLDQKEAEAMVAKTGQMGVPVTEVRYDDGEPEYIVGFDRPRLIAALTIRG